MTKKVPSITRQYLQLLVITPGVFILFSLVLIWLNYSSYKSNKYALYVGEVNKISSFLEESLNYAASFAKEIGQRIADENNLDGKSIGDLLLRLKANMHVKESVLALTLFDFVTPEGYVIANSTRGNIQEPILVKNSDRSWVNFVENEPWILHISKPAKAIISKDEIFVDEIVPLGFGITNQEGKFLGTVSTGLEIDKLNQKLKELIDNSYLNFIILADDYSLVTSSDNILPKYILPKSIEAAIKELKYSKGETGLLTTPFEFRDVYYSHYQVMPNYPFIIIFGENIFSFKRDFEEKTAPAIIQSIILIGILLILFIYFRNKFLLPIVDLANIAEEIVDNKSTISFSANLHSSYEIELLATQLEKLFIYTKELNNTRNDLQQAYEKINTHNTNLEQKVEERTAELQQALAAKTEFLNNMSHEIRTPMQGFTAISTSLVEHWQEFNDERKYELADKIASNAKRLSSLLNHLLDLSKFQAGKMRLSLEKIDLNLIITEMIDEAQTLYINGKQLQINFTPLKDAFILADKERIGQVLRNLFVNSIKFSPNNSTITVSLKLSEITYDDQNKSEAYHFAIKDEGVGVPENELYTIFEVFVQSSKTKTRAGGTGLGLAICKEIIDAHHGEIWAENNQDQGATFNFVIPISQAKQMDGHKIIAENNVEIPTKPAPQTTKSANILIIDDEDACLMSMELLLFGSGYNLHKAAGGYAGLEYLKEHSKEIDLILLDLMMPDIYGLNVLAEIKQNPELAKIPVILQTGSSDSAEIERAFTLGIVTYIKKPYQKQAIMAELERVLSEST
ncbi:Sensor histidine kinase [Rickettsiales bacterium Ac37b]|nr:Sensor histidine kinase [Rickettsiales bacterium Ac37b]